MTKLSVRRSNGHSVIVASYPDFPSLHAINVCMAFEFFATKFKGLPYIYCAQGGRASVPG